MKKRILVPTLAVGALLIGSLVMAGPGGYGRGNCDGDGKSNGNGRGMMNYEQHEERMGQRMDRMETILDLTEEQKGQLETLLNQRYQDKQDLREQMQASREAMREARNADTFNEADFRAKSAVQAELKTEMMVENAKLKQQIRVLLTPEQLEKADTLSGLMGGSGKGRHHGSNGRGF